MSHTLLWMLGKHFCKEPVRISGDFVSWYCTGLQCFEEMHEAWLPPLPPRPHLIHPGRLIASLLPSEVSGQVPSLLCLVDQSCYRLVYTLTPLSSGEMSCKFLTPISPFEVVSSPNNSSGPREKSPASKWVTSGPGFRIQKQVSGFHVKVITLDFKIWPSEMRQGQRLMLAVGKTGKSSWKGPGNKMVLDSVSLKGNVS